jgi:hypothetical protein
VPPVAADRVGSAAFLGERDFCTGAGVLTGDVWASCLVGVGWRTTASAGPGADRFFVR